MLVVIAFLGFFILNDLRTKLSIAIVQVVNLTANPSSHLVGLSVGPLAFKKYE